MRSNVNRNAQGNGMNQLDELAERQTAIQSGIEPPPDGRYGWVCVAACFSINCFTWGAVAPYGVFMGYYLQDDVYPVATAVDFGFIGGLNFSMAMLVSPIVTFIVRRCGIHIPMLLGITLQTTGFITASFATRIWHLYLTQGMLVGFGVGFTYIPSMAIPSQWFIHRCSLANGISAAGAGIGGLMFSLMARRVIRDVSLAWALRITGIVSGFMNLLATITIRSRNHIIQPKHHPFDIALLRRCDVMLVLAWAFVSMLGYIILLFSMSHFAYSIGLDESQAATATALLNLGAALMRPWIGAISDRFGRIETAGYMTFICGIAIFGIWLPSTSYEGLILFVILNGGFFGVFWATIGPICAEVVGLKELPSMLSLTWLVIVLPTTFSEVIALKLRRPVSHHAFLYPQIYAGLAYLIASGFSLELWRVHQKMKLVDHARHRGLPERELSSTGVSP